MKRMIAAVTTAGALMFVPAALAGGGLGGKYKTVITGAPVKFVNATWVINFTPGRYRVTRNGTAVVHGTDTITGNKITLHDHGKGSCPTPGKYRFTLKGKKLTFKLVSDPNKSSACIGRRYVLVGHTWKKV